ncbi:MAG TPA: hypothetical protein VFY71_09160 [Planctomycetota bacterium]|nr:hypothetical protein [Planctomycetota bacterium]
MIFSLAFGCASAVFILCAPCRAQDFGAFKGAVFATSVTTHADLGTYATEAQQDGMSVPPVQGTAGHTTMGGISVCEFDSSANPEMEFLGLTSNDSIPTIAFNAHEFRLVAPYDNISINRTCRLVSAYYHEAAHFEYALFFNSWCESDPAACNAYKACVGGLNKYKDGASPCDEQYAYATEAAKLAEEICHVCNKADMPGLKKTLITGKLQKLQDEANSRCDAASADCMAAATCAQINPPLPPDTPACGGTHTTCNDCPPP